jgi:hypothetical protein
MNGVQSFSPTAPFRLQISKGAILLLGEAACSFAVEHREEIYGWLWLRGVSRTGIYGKL